MASLENFRELLDSGNLGQAFSEYELDFNSEQFDIFGNQQVQGYETDIVWGFEEPNKIKMLKKTAADNTGVKRIYYLPWQSKSVTSVTLDGNSPAYFVTSHFSNCRFTIKFHDGQGKQVTVMHVAGDVTGGATTRGSATRDQMEEQVPVANVTRTRRLSVSSHKFGKSGAAHMEKGIQAGTTYYDTYARVFGVRKDDGGWAFFAQNINGNGEILGFFGI